MQKHTLKQILDEKVYESNCGMNKTIKEAIYFNLINQC